MKSQLAEKECEFDATMTFPRLTPKYGTKASKAQWTRWNTRAIKKIFHNVVRAREIASTPDVFEFHMRKAGWKLTVIDDGTLRFSQFFAPRVEMVIELKV
jgi:hypothetical protein